MFHHFRRTVPALCALALAALGATGCANRVEQGPDERVAEAVDQRVETALDEIEATPAQRTRVHELKEGLLDEFAKMRAKRQATREKVVALWLADQPDPKEAHGLVDERIDDVRGLAHRVTDVVLEVQGLLTAKQRRVLYERIEAEHERWHRRWHGGEP